MFHWEDGLRLTKADLAIDFRRRQPRAFVSHAHADHIARHEYALCTPQTSALYQFRLGRRPTLAMPYREPIEWGGLRLTTYPAGHCLGSAMLLAEDGDKSLLYTGDFKLGPSATAEEAELPRAEILVIETTYGHPDYRLPPRQEVLEQLFRLVRRVLSDGSTPVITAYALGKGQEVTRLLTAEGIPVLQHKSVYQTSRVYESCGVSLGRYGLFQGRSEPGWAVVVPPGTPRLEQLQREVRIAATGWAVDRRARHRLRADHAVALSDHAGYDELFEAVQRVGPETVYCTHGPQQFVQRLRQAGHDAHLLGQRSR